MDVVFKKLNFKDQKEVLTINAPQSFELNLQSIANEAQIIRKVDHLPHIIFTIIFVQYQKQVVDISKVVCPKLFGDAILWFCYPKGTSKRYTCDFNRDTGWNILGEYNMEPVRMVSIDEDWSALRFRKVEFIKKLTRNKKMILSKKGKAR